MRAHKLVIAVLIVLAGLAAGFTIEATKARAAGIKSVVIGEGGATGYQPCRLGTADVGTVIWMVSNRNWEERSTGSGVHRYQCMNFNNQDFAYYAWDAYHGAYFTDTECFDPFWNTNCWVMDGDKTYDNNNQGAIYFGAWILTAW